MLVGLWWKAPLAAASAVFWVKLGFHAADLLRTPGVFAAVVAGTVAIAVFFAQGRRAPAVRARAEGRDRPPIALVTDRANPAPEITDGEERLSRADRFRHSILPVGHSHNSRYRITVAV